ncbi:MAG: three-Cys-motif partner protein TcmP [Thermoleophilia bacterium]|nr:three-Cys-motif partner protein TcmP [Thermoleophilia bacterium]
MNDIAAVEFDEIGYWSEVKLEIVKRYAAAYSKILSAQTNHPLHHVYIDAFAGPGTNISKATGEFIPGSPLNALNINPPFREFFLIDIDTRKVEALRDIVGNKPDVHIYQGDCNPILMEKVFPNVRFEDFRRGLCLLDPYKLNLNWEIIKTAGEMGTIDMFLNFPVMDMNRNSLWRNPENVGDNGIAKMNAFWGDESWRDVAYTTENNLFGFAEKKDNDTIAEGFRKRLVEVAGFKQVPAPIPMRNSNNATVYYLFFASQKPVASGIVKHIFDKYRDQKAN